MTLADFRPRGALAWALTTISVASALPVLVTSYYMLRWVDYDGIGKLGVLGLMFAPRLLAVTLVALPLSWLAHRRRAKLAAIIFGLLAGLTAVLGLLPTVSQRLYARRLGISVSKASIVTPNDSPGTSTTVTYSTTPDGIALLLDVWRAQNVPEGRLRPAIVKIHGGGWNHGSRRDLPEWNRFFNELGYDVFDIDYRLPPPARHLDEIGDVKCAIGWVAENAAKYSIDPARISLMGYSAGAHLALLAAYSMGNPLLPPSCPVRDVAIRSVINHYGPSDVKKHHGDSGSKEYVQRMMHAFIGGSPEEFGNRYELISPIRHVTASAPPTLTLHGQADRVVPIEQAERLDQALAQAGVERETYIIPWADHGFDFIWGSFATRTARALVSAFLAKHG